jgi:two-component system chemotaxis response regulator CheY
MTPHILIVDDDPAIRATISEVLTDEGYQVAMATNGAEALDAIEQALPALILLDMRMPILDGWGFARALGVRRVAVPVIVMSAAQDARRWAEEIRAAGALPKPFDLDELLRTVAQVLQNHHQ